jgi:hypothetical protein
MLKYRTKKDLYVVEFKPQMGGMGGMDCITLTFEFKFEFFSLPFKSSKQSWMFFTYVFLKEL